MICPSSNPPSFGLLLRQVRDGLVRQLDASMAEEDLGIGFTHYIGLKLLARMAASRRHPRCTRSRMCGLGHWP